MNRTEANLETIKTISEIRKNNSNEGVGMIERMTSELCFIEAYLADISRSLAVIADKMREGEAD